MSVVVGDKVTKKQITIGETYGAQTEVTQDLSAGDKVRLASFRAPTGGTRTGKLDQAVTGASTRLVAATGSRAPAKGRSSASAPVGPGPDRPADRVGYPTRALRPGAE